MPTNYYTDSSQDGLSAAELELYNLIMNYRATLGLPSIPLSVGLTITAGRHALDQSENMGGYNGHSWSDAPYDSNNNATWTNMWLAPQRLNTSYKASTGIDFYGYEISTGIPNNGGEMTPADALKSWQGSAPHNDVITNKNTWSTTTWNAIGVGIYKGVAHVWFGKAADPAGAPVVTGPMTGGDGNDILSGNDQNNVLQGFGGNDRLNQSGGSDTMDGGNGVDTAVYTGKRSDYRLDTTSTVKIDKLGGGTDTLISIERIQFSDGTLAFDKGAGEIAGSAYRLYQAAFERTPDTGGLSFWIKEMDKGVRLKNVAENFLASREFVQTYGTAATVTNTKYVELLYQHTLGRAFDQGGLSFWVSRLDTGTNDRADLLVQFSESPENQARVSAAVKDGIWYV